MVSFCASTAKFAGGCNRSPGHSQRRFCCGRSTSDQSSALWQCKGDGLACLSAGLACGALQLQRDDQCREHRLAAGQSCSNRRDPIALAGMIFYHQRKSSGKQAAARWSFDAELVGSLGRCNRSWGRKIHPLHRGQNLFCIFSKLNLTHRAADAFMQPSEQHEPNTT